MTEKRDSEAQKAAYLARSRTDIPPMREEDRGVCLSQLEIAQRLGVSRARVSQLERSAMRKLAAAAAVRGISLEDII